MIESLDEFYSANLGEEVTRGMRESASRGFYLSSSGPYGYRKTKVRDGDKERPRLEVEPNQARVVASIFSGVIQGIVLTPLEGRQPLSQNISPSPTSQIEPTAQMNWSERGIKGVR